MRCLVCLFALFPLPGWAADITVFAAASLANVLETQAEAWEAETGHSVTFVLAGSGTLARQIEQGAPADMFISANVAWMDHLEAGGYLQQGTRRDVAGNTLVLIGAKGHDARLLDLPERLGSGRLALANTQSVPAGIYARQALEAAALWPALAPRSVQADNVRAALLFVSRGEAPFGIVYATDAAIDPGVAVLETLTGHDPIRYPAALTAQGGTEARAFLDALMTPEGQAIFAQHGFTAP
ncbi:molybdate transport system substrate-binding protein [Rubricella aquisinus]|uniref:Molybdate transport system substrate-binding protein n=1 Tax=Rubricella aquisinus TaxID=2028108 RepID=A0A840WXP1_9RHOB|nr:molybdate ABC transporter substrate-binding protein [Rubricella aquisinus]MBB5514446.1 molybdate transport system substrate-binding protein [Rubricella aquisinus]